MKTNTQFKNEALAALKGNWGRALLATLVYVILACLIAGPTTYASLEMQNYVQEHIGNHASARTLNALLTDPAYQLLQSRANSASGLTGLVQILVLVPFTLGYANALRRLLVSGDNEVLRNSVRIATDHYWHKVWGMLLAAIFTFLWTLLLIIPGIVKSFSYAMTKYILEENPELSANEAIDRSRAMMRGHKFDLFWLYLSFIGWVILSIITCGIGFIWLVPYMETAEAAFYEEVKADYAANGGLI